MRIWIVCDNNSNPSIRVFESSQKALEYIGQYDSPKSEDCWIFDEKGSEVE